ncbi:MAG: Zn-dependent carboxypeptidase [Planctomycetota bacterium]|nr:Zn-dependent carboxypeptidase [Planctomycetota bacterium]
MKTRATYEELLGLWRDQALLASCSAVLGWDEQTYLPRGGAEHRGNQLAQLAGLHHEKVTSPRIADALGEIENTDLVATSDSPEAANVREIRRVVDRLSRLPRTLVEELARTTTIAQQEWSLARRENSFARLQPWLEAIFVLKRQEAACLGYVESPYDPLLDEFEPGATARGLDAVFQPLRRELTPLCDAILGSSRRPDPSILRRYYPVDRQRIFSDVVAAAMGFDFEKGRIDLTEHPFCTQLGPGDCRVATRFDARNFGDGFYSVLHEVGHALYDQGTDPAQYGTPMGETASLGIHESQSRLWENTIGRSRPFWDHWLPLARQLFPDSLRDVTTEAFHFANNLVAATLNRVEADEVTYNFHILARFDLEKALIEGDLAVADLPDAWSGAYQKYLGISPSHDAEGCLQDIHWSAGLIGYFPTYALGNLFAAQFFEAASADLPGLDASISKGDFADLLAWLRNRIHRHGQRYRASDLINRVTGSPPSHAPLLRSLRRKYGRLYLD